MASARALPPKPQKAAAWKGHRSPCEHEERETWTDCQVDDPVSRHSGPGAPTFPAAQAALRWTKSASNLLRRGTSEYCGLLMGLARIGPGRALIEIRRTACPQHFQAHF